MVFGSLVLCLWLGTCPVCASEAMDIAEGWRFAPDPHATGLEEGRQLPAYDDSSWPLLNAGQRWEDQGYPDLDGQAWYRKTITVPENMRAERIWLNLGGLNDAGTIWCNGEEVGVFGNAGLTSMAGTPIAVDLTRSIRWGKENLLAIHVLDWGASGGLHKAPCSLTTNRDDLAIQSLFTFAPGFDGRPSIVGLEIGPLGGRVGDLLHMTLAINDEEPLVQDRPAITRNEGHPVGAAAFSIEPNPGDRVHVAAEVLMNGAKPGAGMVFEEVYVWPEPPRWPGKYRHLKVLNNFVTELRTVNRVTKSDSNLPFLNPRDGWVFIAVAAKAEPVANLNDEKVPLIWRKHPETGVYEAMRCLEEGEHILQLRNAEGARLDIRAIPELALCYWPMSTALEVLPERDQAYAERYVLPNMNVLLTRGDVDEQFFRSWQAEGRRWINNSHLPGAHDDAPKAEDVLEAWAARPCANEPGYSGIIVDEFLRHTAAQYAAWKVAVKQFHELPAFKGQTFYGWCGHLYEHEPALEFARILYDLGGRFAWEQYLHEEPTEELALLRLRSKVRDIADWEAVMPGITQRILMCYGVFTGPRVSVDINPNAHFLSLIEDEFQTLAADPLFFGIRGMFQWASHHMDDDVIRYSQRLYRHYCIEGKRAPYREYPYTLTHLENGDFLDGLTAWRTEAAAEGSIYTEHRHGLGRIQGRWSVLGSGDQCAVLARNALRPNRIGQTLKHLEPGKLYRMKFIAADLDDLYKEEEVGLWAEIEGVEVLPDGSFRIVNPGSYAFDMQDDIALGLTSMPYTTLCQVTFRARGTTAEVTFSDWKDGAPAGPVGQRIGFNFVEVQPFYEGEITAPARGLQLSKGEEE